VANDVRAFLCPRCGEPSKSGVYGRVESFNAEMAPPAEFALLQCSHRDCQAPVVQIREDYGLGYDGDKPGIYYPSPRRLSNAIPRALRDEFAEARKCFEAKAYGATLVMVRRTLEGTCADQGSTKHVLRRSTYCDEARTGR